MAVEWPGSKLQFSLRGQVIYLCHCLRTEGQGPGDAGGRSSFRLGAVGGVGGGGWVEGDILGGQH